MLWSPCSCLQTGRGDALKEWNLWPLFNFPSSKSSLNPIYQSKRTVKTTRSRVTCFSGDVVEIRTIHMMRRSWPMSAEKCPGGRIVSLNRTHVLPVEWEHLLQKTITFNIFRYRVDFTQERSCWFRESVRFQCLGIVHWVRYLKVLSGQLVSRDFLPKQQQHRPCQQYHAAQTFGFSQQLFSFHVPSPPLPSIASSCNWTLAINWSLAGVSNSRQATFLHFISASSRLIPFRLSSICSNDSLDLPALNLPGIHLPARNSPRDSPTFAKLHMPVSPATSTSTLQQQHLLTFPSSAILYLQLKTPIYSRQFHTIPNSFLQLDAGLRRTWKLSVQYYERSFPSTAAISIYRHFRFFLSLAGTSYCCYCHL